MGQVVSRPVSAVNNSYTTQFIITASIELSGSTIGCSADDGTYVGGSEVSIMAGNTCMQLLSSRLLLE